MSTSPGTPNIKNPPTIPAVSAGIQAPETVLLSEEILAQIKARAEAATPGPWTARPKILDGRGEINCEIVGNIGPGYSTPVCRLWPGFYRYEQDKAFITEARQDIPALLAHIEYLQGRLDAAVQP